MEGVATAIILQPIVKEFVREILNTNEAPPSVTQTSPPPPIHINQEAVAITEADKDFIEKKKREKYQVARSHYTAEEMKENLQRHQENKDRMLQEQVRSLLDRIT
jgi:hypothetical protein